MSGGDGDHSCSAAARKSSDGEEQEHETEDFYDCEEDLAPPAENQRERTESDGRLNCSGASGQEEVQSHKLQEEKEEEEEDPVPPEERDSQDKMGCDSRKDCSDRAGVEEEGEVEEVLQRVQEEEEEQDSDSELKAEASPGVEFDDDHLREVEKDLTEEEKESRRQESLTLKEAGNSLFKAGDWAEAERSYTEALTLCPVCYSKERSILFSNRAAAKGHLDKKDSAISDCSRAIDLNPDYLRALLRRAELYEQTEKLDEALEDYKKVLERDPSHVGARQACMRLPQQIHERNEKLKEEMMSKLKDLGNMFLRPFGLSTNNFQVNQDSASGSYSINFVQNPNNNNR